jgi:predicted DsbA family dithiol-disulfide isomerase
MLSSCSGLKTSTAMTVEIWSDILCPFCYIGKRRFENALAQFEGANEVVVIWRSFQLNPELVSDSSQTLAQSLAYQKGWTLARAEQAMNQVTEMAKTVGLDYHINEAKVANSFQAHRLLHHAKAHGLQNQAKEALMAAYFIETKNIDDQEVLLQIADRIGLDGDQALAALKDTAMANAVEDDVALARQFGINAVPFYVFDRQYAISGAQESATFLGALNEISAQVKE